MKKTNMKWLSLLAVVVLMMSAVAPVAFAEDDALEIVEMESGMADMDIMSKPILIAPNPNAGATEEGFIPDELTTEAAFDVAIKDAVGEIEGVIEDVIEATGAEPEDMMENAPETAAASESKMIFEPMNFVKNLSYMGVGMLGIFIVIGVIIIAVVVLNKATSPKKTDE